MTEGDTPTPDGPGILRRHASGWTGIPNAALEDDSLSFKARGILAWLLAKPDGWTIRAEAIERAGKEGREAVRSGMRELIAAGYVRRIRVRVGGPGGQWITETQVSELPVPAWTEEQNAAPNRIPTVTPDTSRPTGSRHPGTPQVGFPDAVLNTQTQHSEITAVSPPAADDPTAAPEKPTRKRPGSRPMTDPPDLFPITPTMAGWGRKNAPLVTDPPRETRQFLDHHRSKGTRMRDWSAGWRTWMTNAQKYAERDSKPRAFAPTVDRSRPDQWWLA